MINSSSAYMKLCNKEYCIIKDVNNQNEVVTQEAKRQDMTEILLSPLKQYFLLLCPSLFFSFFKEKKQCTWKRVKPFNLLIETFFI